jgi:enamine deaminase RidA (YjgF/YER057c/UK114 family)
MTTMIPVPRAVAACCAIATLSACVAAGGGAAQPPVVERTALLGSTFPISAAVSVRAGADTVFVSGALPPVIDKDAPKGSVAAYGDMATQAAGAIESIKATLGRLGLGLGDVVKMTVFMVADPTKDNKLDFAGLMAGYSKYFGTAEQPNKPARSAVQVAALVAPGALVEIEVIAAKAH